MKLSEKYNRINIFATILVFIAGSCAFFFLLNYILTHELDETLQTEQQEIITYIKMHGTLPEIIDTKEQYITYAKAPDLVNTSYKTVKNRFNNEEESLREMQFGILVSGQYYIVKVDKPLEETESLLQVIIGVTIGMIALILMTGYFINRIIIARLWQPFYETIARIKRYQVTDRQALAPGPVTTDEFVLLNQSLYELTERIQRDYGALKNFTGQAAHEIQTPLAIIRTRLDALIQNETILQTNAAIIADIENAVHRLSRLHQSLLLLTRMEHKQFQLSEPVRIDTIIADKCKEYREIEESKQFPIMTDMEPTLILFHQHLADILINNLLNNAIRYNVPHGKVKITLKNGLLTIANTSANAELDNSKLFKRFYRGDSNEEGNGLGLSIVKEICTLGNFTLSYAYKNEEHIFTIFFPNAKALHKNY